MNQGTIHIIGAGLAGLSAAVQIADSGRNVFVYEAAGHAGGRCRSYYDSTFGATIDNGNHLLLSGNDAARTYLTRLGASDIFNKTEQPVFHFTEAKTAKRWALRLNKGKLPLWLLDKTRRVPGTKITDYFSILRLLHAKSHESVTSLLDTSTLLYKHLWRMLLLSALNTDPEEASAILAGAILRGTLLKGGNACIPLVAQGLSHIFIDPALRYLSSHNATVLFNHRLSGINFEDGKAARLEFANNQPVKLSASDTVICAIPPWAIASLLPDVSFPNDYRAILNVHFRIAAPASFPAIMGVVGATSEWIFAFPDRVSVTVSDAGRLMQEEREILAQRIWQEVAAITGLPAAPVPIWQIVKEKRATFAATPKQDAMRPGARTLWPNLYLAGDWVQTGLPATIEGAIYSGAHAAEMIMKTL